MKKSIVFILLIISSVSFAQVSVFTKYSDGKLSPCATIFGKKPINDKMSFQKMMDDIPYIYSKLSAYNEGWCLYLSIICMIKKENIPNFLPQAYLSCSKLLMSNEQNEKAEDYILDSLNLSKEQCLIKEEGEAYELLGDLYRKNGDLGYKSCYEEAISIYENCDYPNRIKRVTEKLNNLN